MRKIYYLRLLNIFRIFVNGFFLFALFYNSHRYFAPWDVNKPLIPLGLLMVKDLIWILINVFGLCLIWSSLKSKILVYNQDNVYKNISRFYIFMHLFLLGVAAVHLNHRFAIDVFQRDIKNVEYLFLPLFLPLVLFDKNKLINISKWLVFVTVLMSSLAYVIFYAFPEFSTGMGRISSSFPGPNEFGFFLNLPLFILFSCVLLLRNRLHSYISLLFFMFIFGSLLLTGSISSLVSFFAGVILITIYSLVYYKVKYRICMFLMMFFISNALFYMLGFQDVLLTHTKQAYQGYRIYNELTPEHKFEKEVLDSDVVNKSLSVNQLFSVYRPQHDNRRDPNIEKKVKYTSLASRFHGFRTFFSFLRQFSLKDLLFGNFQLKRYYESDNSFFSFIVNDGIIVTLFFMIFFSLIIYTSAKRINYIQCLEIKIIFLALLVFLLTAFLLQFNSSDSLNIFPLNLIIYSVSFYLLRIPQEKRVILV